MCRVAASTTHAGTVYGFVEDAGSCINKEKIVNCKLYKEEVVGTGSSPDWKWTLWLVMPLQEIAEPLFDLKLGMEQLASNQTFRRILATLLAIGNFLNSSSVGAHRHTHKRYGLGNA